MGNEIAKYKSEPGGYIKRFQPNSLVSTMKPSHQRTDLAVKMGSVTVCYEATGYNYSGSNPEERHYWSISLGCNTYYFDDGIGYSNNQFTSDEYYGGGGGSSSIPSVPFVVLRGGDNVIGNIQDYNKCFTNVAGSHTQYEVTVCVAQPIHGTRETWGFSAGQGSAGRNPVNVGHVFLILKQETGFSTIVRNVGFYPAGSVDPSSPSAEGQLNNDSRRNYSVGVSIRMNNSQFFNVLNFINENANVRYNLNSNNCTSFALNALSSAGFGLPRTIGNWPMGSGYNPGDLGEDIKRMNLEPNMTLKTPESHPNLGTCYY